MPAETPLEVKCNERTTFRYTTYLRDETGTLIPANTINSIVLTIVEAASGDIVNSRNAQSILNVNGGTMHATSGLLTIIFSALDTAIVGTTEIGARERHLATITITYATSKKAHREIRLLCKNLRSVS